MDAALLNIIIIGVSKLIEVAPRVAAEIGALMQKGNPTPADWDRIRALVKPYEAYGINPPANRGSGQ